MATIYLKYDGALQCSTDDKSWEKMTEGTIIGCNSNELISWQISDQDDQMQELQSIVPIEGKSSVRLPSGGHWEDEWEVIPKVVSEKEIQGCPMPKDATKEKPAVYAYNISFVLKSNPQKVITIDPGTQVPGQ